MGADADPGVGAVAAAGVAGVVADADDDPDGLVTTASTAAGAAVALFSHDTNLRKSGLEVLSHSFIAHAQ